MGSGSRFEVGFARYFVRRQGWKHRWRLCGWEEEDEIEDVEGRANPVEVGMRMTMVIMTRERTGILAGVLMFLG